MIWLSAERDVFIADFLYEEILLKTAAVQRDDYQRSCRLRWQPRSIAMTSHPHRPHVTPMNQPVHHQRDHQRRRNQYQCQCGAKGPV